MNWKVDSFLDITVVVVLFKKKLWCGCDLLPSVQSTYAYLDASKLRDELWAWWYKYLL